MTEAQNPQNPEQGQDKPGAIDTSEAVNVTTNLEEATEAGYLGASFDDEDLTVEGVTSEHHGGAAPDAPKSADEAKEQYGEPQRDKSDTAPAPSESESESESQSQPTPPPTKKDKGAK